MTDGIVAVPTLVKRFRCRPRKLIGNLADPTGCGPGLEIDRLDRHRHGATGDDTGVTRQAGGCGRCHRPS